MAWYDILDTELGRLFVGGSDEGVHRINFVTDQRTLDDEVHSLEADSGEPVAHDPDAARPAVEALAAWFEDADREPDPLADLRLAPRGTAFQQRVWQALREIPAGSTASYTEIARRIGAPKAVRGVAQACAANPVAVAIPCHRVVRSDGTLAGYRWGVERKRALLEREATR